MKNKPNKTKSKNEGKLKKYLENKNGVHVKSSNRNNRHVCK